MTHLVQHGVFVFLQWAVEAKQTIPENQKAVGDCFMTIGCQDTGVMLPMGEHQAERPSVAHWCYGHFHQSLRANIDGILFKMLDIMELDEI